MDLGLKDKVAFISASSKGLGKGCALELAKEGAHVIISSRSEEDLIQAKREIEAVAKGRVEYVVCDVTKSADITKAIAFANEKFGKVDILINNAGGPPAGDFDKMGDDDWYHAFELNLLSFVRFIREVVPRMKEQQSGRIINLASSSVKQPISGLILSNTFRPGVVGLSKTLSQELAPFNILVNTVSPGSIATDRLLSLNQTRADKLGISIEEVEGNVKKSIPLGRYGDVSEFGKVVAFLASDVSSYITGSSLLIDGGSVKSL
ncbi:SDR family oxidoreductase [Sporosarcina sp. G11-34]|uniref:SDR family oxidoreductase n=1 Tax=Sporosarcina sp. G11-34 TaxID=2849605 RepID=UPI0022A94B84|nr:SDR family oxidoreductase [Sporosarcina sp. G11-34]MCZ2258345.1 SDR family oxidoreductase [Sporosarcina sp. G11-34]